MLEVIDDEKKFAVADRVQNVCDSHSNNRADHTKRTGADLIVMMDKGTVVDVGSHDELLVRCAPYAELFDIQAARYRD